MDSSIYAQNLKKVSQIFLGIIKCFVGFNFFMLGFAIYNMITSPETMFRTNFWLFLLFLGNFWIMLFFFLILSLCMKICMLSFEPSLEDVPRIWPLLYSFLTGDPTEEDLAAHLSLLESENDDRPPPDNNQIMNIELTWGSIFKTPESFPPEEKCIICLQLLDPLNVVALSCDCPTFFHKKCVLEWFHFNQKENEHQQKTVSCPSCRHLFQE